MESGIYPALLITVFGTCGVSLVLFPTGLVAPSLGSLGCALSKTLGGAGLLVNLAEFTLWEGVAWGGKRRSPAF